MTRMSRDHCCRLLGFSQVHQYFHKSAQPLLMVFAGFETVSLVLFLYASSSFLGSFLVFIMTREHAANYRVVLLNLLQKKAKYMLLMDK